MSLCTSWIVAVVLVACAPSRLTLLHPSQIPPDKQLLADLRQEAGVLAVTPVRVELQVLQAPSFDIRIGRLRLRVTGVRIERRTNDYSCFGRIGLDGFIALVVANGLVVGTIDTGRETYQIRPIGGVHILIKRGFTGLPQLHPPGFAVVQGRPGSLPTLPTQSPNEMTTIKVIVVYTTAVQAKRPEIALLIQQAIDEANIVNDRSGVKIRFELAGPYLDEYEEDLDFENNLTRLVDKTDDDLKAVHVRRDANFADLAILLIDGGTNTYLGMARAVMAVENKAFAVVDYRYVNAPYYTVEHEIGHLMGLEHDASGAPPKNYAHGYVTPGWRTVMAILCTDNERCQRKANWSNPRVSIDKTPTGNATTADSARALGDAAPVVSG